jgi:hypothetical protein
MAVTELEQMIEKIEAAGYRCGYAITEAEARAEGADLLFDRAGRYRALTLKGIALLDLHRQVLTAAKELALEFTPEEIAQVSVPADGAICRVSLTSPVTSTEQFSKDCPAHTKTHTRGAEIMHETEPTSQAILDALPPLLVTVGQHRRVRSSELMAALGCLAKPLVTPMHALGFKGPMALRFPRRDGTSVVTSGYQRPLQRGEPVLPQQREPIVEADDVVAEEDGTDQRDLAGHLVRVTRKALTKASQVLSHRTDFENAGLLRAQVQMASAVMGTAARVDDAQLRRRAVGDVLDRLEKLMAEQRALLPKQSATTIDAVTGEPVEQAAGEPPAT